MKLVRYWSQESWVTIFENIDKKLWPVCPKTLTRMRNKRKTQPIGKLFASHTIAKKLLQKIVVSVYFVTGCLNFLSLKRNVWRKYEVLKIKWYFLEMNYHAMLYYIGKKNKKSKNPYWRVLLCRLFLVQAFA